MSDWRIEMINRRVIIVHATGSTRSPQQMIAQAIEQSLPLDGTTEITIRREPEAED
jgi:hypothetical protein